MKIVYLSDYQHGGGAETMAVSQFEWVMAQAGMEARFYSWGHAVGGRMTAIEDRFHAYPKSPRSMRATVLRLLKEWEEFAPDVIHIHNIHESRFPLEWPFLLAAKYPVVWTFHDLWPVTGGCCLPQNCPRLASSCALGCPDDGVQRSFCSRYPVPAQFSRLQRLWGSSSVPWVIAPSRYMEKRIRSTAVGVAIPGLSMIHNGVSSFAALDSRGRTEFDALPHPRILLVASSFALPYKGANEAVALLKAVFESGLSFSVIWLGGSSESFAAASSGFCRSHAVPFTTSMGRVGSIFRQADILLMPSQVENFPTTILEAMSCKLPVVAHEVGGVAEQVRQGQTGFCYRNVAEGVVALKRMLSMSESDRQAVGHNAGLVFSDHFSMEACMRQHVDLYRARVASFRPALPACRIPLKSWNRTVETRTEILSRWAIRNMRRQQAELERQRATHKAGLASKLRDVYVLQRLELLRYRINKPCPEIALYGAGQHTRWLLDVLRTMGAWSIACILDDNPNAASLEGLSVTPLSEARLSDLDAIILSSEIHESAMHKKIGNLPHGRALIWPLYPDLPMADILSILPPKPAPAGEGLSGAGSKRERGKCAFEAPH